MPSLLGGGDLAQPFSSFSLVGALFSLNCYVVSFLEEDRSQEEIEETTKAVMILGFAILLSLFNVSWVRLAVAMYPEPPGHGDCFEFVVPDDFGSASNCGCWIVALGISRIIRFTVFSLTFR